MQTKPTIERKFSNFGTIVPKEDLGPMHGEHEHQRISNQLNENEILTNPRQSTTNIERAPQQ